MDEEKTKVNELLSRLVVSPLIEGVVDENVYDQPPDNPAIDICKAMIALSLEENKNKKTDCFFICIKEVRNRSGRMKFIMHRIKCTDSLKDIKEIIERGIVKNKPLKEYKITMIMFEYVAGVIAFKEYKTFV